MGKIADPAEIFSTLKRVFTDARNLFFSNLAGEGVAAETGRVGDCEIPLDLALENLYRHKIQDLGGTLYAEGCAEPMPVSGDFPLIFILDPLDGTVNALSGMRCGVSIAFGVLEGETFTIGDIQGVMIADYLTGRMFSWYQDGEPRITPARYWPDEFDTSTVSHQVKRPATPPARHHTGELNTPDLCRLFEVPDSLAYAPTGKKNRVTEQENLLAAFREVFPDCQRRAIDCTSLQMLEPLAGNLAAYGDLRQQARIWDTIASIRFILAHGEPWMAVDADWRPYTGRDIIFRRDTAGGLRSNDELGRSVIVAKRPDMELLEKHFTTGVITMDERGNK
jgi:fructose-1,6-bisphosphatase/inositol monophosphatase family enzyme